MTISTDSPNDPLVILAEALSDADAPSVDVCLVESAPTPTAAPSGARADKLAALRAHFERWYADFSWPAMEVVLCAIAAHYLERETQPLWPFIVGAPRGGKTEIIRALEGLPQAYPIGDLTPKTLMSAHPMAQGGLLARLQDQKKSILLFKDFTTMLSKHPNDRNEILAWLREIADGSFSRNTGVGEGLAWVGHLTIIAAVTGAIEEAQEMMQTLGPRFLFVRWHAADARKAARMAWSQIGKEGAIHKTAQRLVRDIFHGCGALKATGKLHREHEESLLDLCAFYVQMRQPVSWDHFRKCVDRVHDAEGTGSIAKHLRLLTEMRATLYGRTTTDDDDLALAARVALDSCPSQRLRIVRYLAGRQGAVNGLDLRKALGMSESQGRRYVDELEAIGIVTVERDYHDGNHVVLNAKFAQEFRGVLGFGSSLL